MKITYTLFPALLFCSYNKDNAPDGLPLIIDSEETKTKISKAQGLIDLLPSIAAYNTLGESPKNYWLNDTLYNKVEFDEQFRQTHFARFFSVNHKRKYGVICFQNGGQYVYLLDHKISGQATLTCALYLSNVFIGYEQAVITEQGVGIEGDGIYAADMVTGGYISFVAVALSALAEKPSKKVSDQFNSTSEIIYEI